MTWRIGVGALASVFIGYLMARICLWTVNNALRGQHRQQQASIFLFVCGSHQDLSSTKDSFSFSYGVWLVNENSVMSGSGILALVVFGLTLSHYKQFINPLAVKVY